MADFSTVRGGTAYDNDGSKVGKVDGIYTDKDTGEPSFVTIHTGLFGSKTTFVPLSEASVEGKDLRLPYTKAKIKDAPGVEPDVDITDAEQDRLYDYYGVGGHSTTGTSGTTGTGTVPRGGTDNDDFVDRERERGGQVGHDVSGPTTDDAMTRSKEELRVGTRREETGRAKMRKYVTTERVSEQVPVSHEEVRVTSEPITDANREVSLDGPEITEAEHEVTLHAERAVADKETVPVERIRLDTETVRGTERVEADVREEQIEVEDGTTDVRDGKRRH